MKANEITIGDWVVVNDTDHPNPMQVDGIYKKSGAYYAVLSSDLLADVDVLSPISLTKEILEKICDKVDPIEGNIHHYVEYRFGDDILISSEDDYPLMLYFENTPGDYVHVKVEYVHKLQHWLRSLEYEREIEL